MQSSISSIQPSCTIKLSNFFPPILSNKNVFVGISCQNGPRRSSYRMNLYSINYPTYASWLMHELQWLENFLLLRWKQIGFSNSWVVERKWGHNCSKSFVYFVLGGELILISRGWNVWKKNFVPRETISLLLMRLAQFFFCYFPELFIRWTKLEQV